MQNANHYHHAEEAQKKFKALLELIKSIQSEMGANSLIFTITQRTVKIVDADRLHFISRGYREGSLCNEGEVNIRISMDQDSRCCRHEWNFEQYSMLTRHAFQSSHRQKIRYRTKAILCLPIKGGWISYWRTTTDKQNGWNWCFHFEDEDIMTILNAAGPILGESQLYLQIQGKSRKEENELEGVLSVVLVLPEKWLVSTKMTRKKRKASNQKTLHSRYGRYHLKQLSSFFDNQCGC